jgi:hypothetical protein
VNPQPPHCALLTETHLVRLESGWLLQFAPGQHIWSFDSLGEALRWLCWETYSGNYQLSQLKGERTSHGDKRH